MHPDHINDVLDALSHLQTTYRFSSNYILVGHSAGATLTMQVAMSRAWSDTGPSNVQRSSPAVPPIAIVGVCGIYDLPELLVSHTHPVYRTFVTSAFGQRVRDGVDVWKKASPTSGTFDTAAWPSGRYVLLAHGTEDELIGWRQVELMQETLLAQGWTEPGQSERSQRTVEVMPLSGAHDDVWQKGHELARAIETCLQRVFSIARD